MGQGYTVRMQTDFIGPFPSTAQWQWNIFDIPTTRILMLGSSEFNPGHIFNAVLGAHSSANGFTSAPGAGDAFGADVGMQVGFIDTATNTAIDGPTNFITFAWDPSGGIFALVQLAAASGTFTDQDRLLLSQVWNATAVNTYSTALTHVGLSDSGVILTQPATRSLRVTVTTFPANVIVDPGSPEYFFNLGFLTINDADGFMRSQRLVFEHQTYPCRPSTTGFGWTLRN